MSEKNIFNSVIEKTGLNTSLKATLTFWFLLVSIAPFTIAIVFSLNYFEKNLTEEFQNRLVKNHEGVEIELGEMFAALKEMSEKNANDEWVVSATMQKETDSLSAITLYLLKLESLDEISVYDYKGIKLAYSRNPALQKIQKAALGLHKSAKEKTFLAFLNVNEAHAADDNLGFDIDVLDAEPATNGNSTEASRGIPLDKSLVDKIISAGELSIKSIDPDYGYRFDVYQVIKEIGVDRVSGIMRNSLFIDNRFCLKYKLKTGIDLLILSKEMMVSSLGSNTAQNVDFSDFYERLSVDEHYIGTKEIDEVENEFFLQPLKNDDGMLNAGMILFLSKEAFLKSIKDIKISLAGLGIAILILVLILSISIAKLITGPINIVLNKLKEISHGKGDLTERIVVSSTNEIGLLAKWFNKFMENMQEIVSSINDVSSALSTSSHDIVYKMKKINDGTGSQMESVTSTLSSIEEMNASTKGIAEAVSELANSSEKSSSAVLETDASTKELSKNSDILSSSVESAAMSIGEMVASIKQVDNHAGVLKMITTDTQESMQQIDDSITKIEDNANQTVKLSEQSISDASAGMTSVKETIKGINMIKDSVGRASSVIESLGHKITSIDDILDVIDNVAEQTNLLALNAAIIAAQAGEHGKGFAIVADEIKDLADRTGASTKEIANIIISVQKESKNAVEVMKVSSENVIKSVSLSKEAGDTLEKILANAEKSTGRVKDIASSTVVQSNKTSEIMKSMAEVSQMVSQISSATKEQSVGSNMILKATESIKDIAYQLKTAVREQTLASKDISSEIMNVSQMVKQINRAVSTQQEKSDSVLTAIRTINDNAKDNQEIVINLEEVVETLENKSAVLNKEIGKFKV
ncbi:methyl-accepting chemotaxis protein [Thermodesulfobacteriota bacterium]